MNTTNAAALADTLRAALASNDIAAMFRAVLDSGLRGDGAEMIMAAANVAGMVGDVSANRREQAAAKLPRLLQMFEREIASVNAGAPHYGAMWFRLTA